jgi:hypothetical protein
MDRQASPQIMFSFAVIMVNRVGRETGDGASQ